MCLTVSGRFLTPPATLNQRLQADNVKRVNLSPNAQPRLSEQQLKTWHFTYATIYRSPSHYWAFTKLKPSHFIPNLSHFLSHLSLYRKYVSQFQLRVLYSLYLLLPLNYTKSRLRTIFFLPVKLSSSTAKSIHICTTIPSYLRCFSYMNFKAH